MPLLNAKDLEEDIFKFEGVRVTVEVANRNTKFGQFPYSQYVDRRLANVARVSTLKSRVRVYFDKEITVIKGDSTVAENNERLSDIRKSYQS